MQVLEYYLRGQLLKITAITFSALMLIFFIGQSVNAVQMVMEQGLSYQWILWALAIELPFFINLFLPLAFFIGILITFNLMVQNQEYLAILASGIDIKPWRHAIFKPALYLGIIIAILSLWLQPTVYQFRQSLLSNLQNEALQILLKPKQIVSLYQNRWVMYAQKDNKDIFVAKRPDKASAPWSIITADHVTSSTINHIKKLSWHHGKYYLFDNKNHTINIIGFNHYHTTLPQLKISAAHNVLEHINTLTLWKNRFLKSYNAHLQFRCIPVISILLFAALAYFITLNLPIEKNHRNARTVLLAACLTYLVYILLIHIAEKWYVSHYTPSVLGLWWPTLPVILCLFYLHRRRISRILPKDQ